MLADKTLMVSLPAADLARARNWYRDKLDLKPAREDAEEGLWYETGDSRWLVYQSQFAGTNQATAAAWQVDDMDGTVAELGNRGVVFEEYDIEDLKTEDGIMTLPTGQKAAWFKDSEGNILGLFQDV